MSITDTLTKAANTQEACGFGSEAIALRELVDRYRWRPISEIHEDFGECVLIDINSPGRIAVGKYDDADFESSWTHFSRIVPLSHEEAVKLGEAAQ